VFERITHPTILIDRTPEPPKPEDVLVVGHVLVWIREQWPCLTYNEARTVATFVYKRRERISWQSLAKRIVQIHFKKTTT
jgi:hypothetical protein